MSFDDCTVDWLLDRAERPVQAPYSAETAPKATDLPEPQPNASETLPPGENTIEYQCFIEIMVEGPSSGKGGVQVGGPIDGANCPSTAFSPALEHGDLIEVQYFGCDQASFLGETFRSKSGGTLPPLCRLLLASGWPPSTVIRPAYGDVPAFAEDRPIEYWARWAFHEDAELGVRRREFRITNR